MLASDAASPEPACALTGARSRVESGDVERGESGENGESEWRA
jgi:hypothetical protein